MLFAHLLAEDRPPTELLAADYTFLNEPLAKFYGVEGVEGSRNAQSRLAAQIAPRRAVDPW